MGMVLMFPKRKGRCSIMKKSCFSLSILAFLLVSTADVLLAQYGYEACIVVLQGQNRNRTVDGEIDTECGPVHSAPWGNWGVNSNYGPTRDTSQFQGWYHADGPRTKLQWNSCTTKIPFSLKSCIYHNAPRPGSPSHYCEMQRSNGVVTHGTLKYRYSYRPCPPPWWPTQPSDFSGCRGTKTVGQGSNFMTLYELDGWFGSTETSGDGNDLIETLYFPGTSLTLTNCTKEGCPEKTTGWVRKTRDTHRDRIVEAELRMKASAYYEACDWSWTE